MDFNVESLRGEVNNQNLLGFNLIQNNMNTAIVRDPNYQHMHCSDKVLNLFRVGLVLNTEGAQGDFNSLFFNLYLFVCLDLIFEKIRLYLLFKQGLDSS